MSLRQDDLSGHVARGYSQTSPLRRSCAPSRGRIRPAKCPRPRARGLSRRMRQARPAARSPRSPARQFAFSRTFPYGYRATTSSRWSASTLDGVPRAPEHSGGRWAAVFERSEHSGRGVRVVWGPRTYSPPCADRRLLATPASRSRVSDCDPNHGRLFGIAPPRGLAAHCPAHCSVCVAQGIKATPTRRHPHLPPSFEGSLAREPILGN